MEWLKYLSLTVTIISVLINLQITSCEDSSNNKLNEYVTISNSTPTLKSIIEPDAHMTEEIYKLLIPIEDEIHKLSKDEFRVFLKKLLNRLKKDYETLFEVYRNFEMEEKEEDDPSNSTLIKRVKRTFKKGGGGCFQCGGGGGYGQGFPVPVVIKPNYYGGGGCGGGCGYNRPRYQPQPYCNQCGQPGYGGYGGGGGGSFSQAQASASSYGG